MARVVAAGRGTCILVGLALGALPSVSAAQGNFADAKMYVQAGSTSLRGDATHAMTMGAVVPSGLFEGIRRDAGPLTLHWDLWASHWRSHHAGGTTGGYTQLGALLGWRYQPADQQSPWFIEAGLGGSVTDRLYSSRERQFSTAFQFTEVLAVGYRFGPEKAYEVSLRVQHFSNAGIKKPNPGENFMFLRFSLPL
ncbi:MULTISPECIES: acyloxyacyl hydrolase [Pseudomonadota]|uniref:acyloxyacyl hydrolase n=1 Tax=Pseudomonadota TaxID=1224 RepID=UPI0008380236|nr:MULTISPECIES: acyloxyacyl hydrolase [unclassified Variovorax]MCQ4249807.1 acyloxyacyl hydrolase [Stutzerimonas stutzeri]